MLRITIPSNDAGGFDFNLIQSMDIPKPVNGINEEEDSSAVMAFNDEEDAIDYSFLLRKFAANQEEKNSVKYAVTQCIIQAITADAFVVAYNSN